MDPFQLCDGAGETGEEEGAPAFEADFVEAMERATGLLCEAVGLEGLPRFGHRFSGMVLPVRWAACGFGRAPSGLEWDDRVYLFAYELAFRTPYVGAVTALEFIAEMGSESLPPSTGREGRGGFPDALAYLRWHPCYAGHFDECLDYECRSVCPHTDMVEADPSLNTHPTIWIECGPYVAGEGGGIIRCHDVDLDCGGDTFEDAIVSLAYLTALSYGGLDVWLRLSVASENGDAPLPGIGGRPSPSFGGETAPARARRSCLGAAPGPLPARGPRACAGSSRTCATAWRSCSASGPWAP